jgi:hypothetical protein
MKALAWDFGVAGTRALVPQPAAFAAAAQRKAEHDEAQNRGDTLMHAHSLAHRHWRREGSLALGN